ncbi:MAG: [NiFe]-hydrogenase assembly chaperone HybE [Gammaproteobacteria bacterium]|nr:[NiFe]-hydrogenase assembly chaperone HybE [Gammaproteobacteria bacterium]MBU1416563.1 [NiFe]-hydrogenase assembly chaperone HybE [Gammaproteobacteria bacterium]
MYSKHKLGIAGLEAAFRRIAATRMAGLPISHPRLTVESVGFRLWEGKWLGVLVTPWAVNLVLLPGDDTEFEKLAVDRRQTWRFPSGDFDFMGGDEEECGAYQFCSLLSPIPEAETTDQEAARALAEEVLAKLFVDPDEEVVMMPAREDTPRRSLLSGRLSRRGFLSGGLLAARD